MTVTTMNILGSDGVKQPTLALDVEWDTALAIYCERRWPVGRRKAIEREWDLSVDDARSVVEGKASKRILSKIWKHPRGGWAVALPIMGAVIGQPVSTFFREQNLKAAREAANALEHERAARAAYRRLASDVDPSGDARDRAETAREARSFTRTVGAEPPRRVAGRSD